MIDALIVLSLMAIVFLFLAWRKNKLGQSFLEAKNMLLNVLPLLICAFVIVGFMNILIPEKVLQTWLGEEAGWRGLLIGPLVGALIQGGPYAFFPLFDAVFRQNVSTGTAVAMITAWGMINVGHLPYEFTFLGPRFVALKYAVYLFVPTLAGYLAGLLF